MVLTYDLTGRRASATSTATINTADGSGNPVSFAGTRRKDYTYSEDGYLISF